MSCSVWGCSNSNPASADPSVHYYVFPKHPIIAQQWLLACGWPPEELDITTARICSIHFSEDSYTTEVKLIEYITCYTKVLKFDAVPTLFLPLTTQVVIKEADPQEELREMIVFPSQNNEESLHPKKEYVNLVTSEDNVMQGPNVEEQKSMRTKPSTVSAEQNLDKYTKIQTKEQLTALESSNKAIRDKVLTLEKCTQRLRKLLLGLMDTYKAKDLELSKRHEEYLRSKRTLLSLEKQKKLLAKVFSESQIKILSGKKKIYWSNDDMAVGYTIRHLSNKRCYMYLTKKLNIPLPAVSSIKRWMNVKGADGKKALTASSPKRAEEEESE